MKVTDKMIKVACDIYEADSYFVAHGSRMKSALEAVFSLIEEESVDNAQCKIPAGSLKNGDVVEITMSSKPSEWNSVQSARAALYGTFNWNSSDIKKQPDNEGWIEWEAKGIKNFPPNVTTMTLVDIKDSLDPLRDCSRIQAKEVWWSHVKAYRILPNQTPEKEEFKGNPHEFGTSLYLRWNLKEDQKRTQELYNESYKATPEKEKIPTLLEYALRLHDLPTLMELPVMAMLAINSEYLDKYMMEKV